MQNVNVLKGMKGERGLFGKRKGTSGRRMENEEGNGE
jgi:hypothetical protein